MVERWDYSDRACCGGLYGVVSNRKQESRLLLDAVAIQADDVEHLLI